jgi:organic radical activating enzyme
VHNLIQPGDIIVITGGEPFLQNLQPMLESLQQFRTLVCIETNGTLLTATEINLCSQFGNWLTVSPKVGYLSTASQAIAAAHEIKVVYGDYDPAKIVGWICTDHRYIQPKSENFKTAVEYVLNHPMWRLSIQIHKVVGVQ